MVCVQMAAFCSLWGLLWQARDRTQETAPLSLQYGGDRGDSRPVLSVVFILPCWCGKKPSSSRPSQSKRSAGSEGLSRSLATCTPGPPALLSGRRGGRLSGTNSPCSGGRRTSPSPAIRRAEEKSPVQALTWELAAGPTRSIAEPVRAPRPGPGGSTPVPTGPAHAWGVGSLGDPGSGPWGVCKLRTGRQGRQSRAAGADVSPRPLPNTPPGRPSPSRGELLSASLGPAAPARHRPRHEPRGHPCPAPLPADPRSAGASPGRTSRRWLPAAVGV